MNDSTSKCLRCSRTWVTSLETPRDEWMALQREVREHVCTNQSDGDS